MSESVFFWVAGLTAIILFIRYLIVYVLIPGLHWAKSFNEFMEAQPTLMEIADQFKPNGGESLRDQIDQANVRLENIEQQLEALLTEAPWDGEERRDQGNTKLLN